MNNNKPLKGLSGNSSFFQKAKIFISDLFHKNPYVPYPWNCDNFKRFHYDEQTQIINNNLYVFPLCFGFNEYLELKTWFLTDNNFILLFHLDNNKSFGFDAYSDN